MAPQIAMNRQQIADFCRKWQVSEFYVFGSVLRDDFGPESDIDVAVRFSPGATYSLFDLVDMEEELRSLFGRPDDVLVVDMLRFARQAALRTSAVDAPWNGRSPESISYSTAPKLKTSDRASGAMPCACSGAM